jgi:hypothetical protein
VSRLLEVLFSLFGRSNVNGQPVSLVVVWFATSRTTRLVIIIVWHKRFQIDEQGSVVYVKSRRIHYTYGTRGDGSVPSPATRSHQRRRCALHCPVRGVR